MAPRRSPPASVAAAIAALGVATAVQLALALLVVRAGSVGWGQFLFAAVVAVALLAGLARRSRLAWLWGRYLTAFLAVLEAAAIAVGLARHQIGVGLLAVGALGLVLPLVVVSVALSRPSAFAFYGLVCPACGSRTSLGSTFLFREARCRSCQNVW